MNARNRLDALLEEIAAGRTVEEDPSPQLAPLVEAGRTIARAVQGLPASPNRERILSEVLAGRVPVRRRTILERFGLDGPWTPRPAARGLLAAATIVVLAVPTLVILSRGSLPGDSLYPLRRGTNETIARLTFGDRDRAEALVRLAARDLDDVERLLERRRFADAERALATFERDLDRARDAVGSLPSGQRGDLEGRIAELEDRAAELEEELVEAARPADAPGAGTSPSPAPTGRPTPEATPEPTRTPERTETPEPARTPRATETPRPTESPRPTETPEPAETPEPTETPEAED